MFNLEQRAAELGSVPKPQFPDTFFPHEKYSGLTRAERRAVNRAYKKALRSNTPQPPQKKRRKA